MEDNTKKCAHCKEVKPKTEFTKYKQNKDGLFSYCRKCKSIKAKEDRERNFERIKSYMKEYNKNMPEGVKEKKIKRRKEWYEETREQILTRTKEKYEKNKDKILKRSREYYQKTKEKYKSTRRKWEENNRAKRKLMTAKRKVLKLKNGLFKISEKEIDRLLSKKCYLCGEKDSEHIDHIIPLSKGGSHSIGNLLGACSACNLSKGAKLLIQYKRDRIN
jgi:5-methylcytosine-specific restriction endonuclease McrA